MSVRDPLGFNLIVRKLRKDRGWSLRDVEKLTGGRLSNAYLSQLESGQVENPSVKTVHLIATAYGADFEELCRLAMNGVEPLPDIPCCPTCGRPYA